MSIDKLLGIFDNLSSLDSSEIAALRKSYHPVSFKKKEKIVDVGQTAEHFYFINTGLLRLYGYKEGEEKTLFFFYENMTAGSLDSFMKQVPSELVLEAIEETEALKISRADLESLFNSSSNLTKIGLVLTQLRMSELLGFYSSFVLDSPEERYQKFVQSHPDLIQRVPQHIIASFLGITPVSLSRIRKRLQSKT